jgi:hypothetical protein
MDAMVRWIQRLTVNKDLSAQSGRPNQGSPSVRLSEFAVVKQRAGVAGSAKETETGQPLGPPSSPRQRERVTSVTQACCNAPALKYSILLAGHQTGCALS